MQFSSSTEYSNNATHYTKLQSLQLCTTTVLIHHPQTQAESEEREERGNCQNTPLQRFTIPINVTLIDLFPTKLTLRLTVRLLHKPHSSSPIHIIPIENQFHVGSLSTLSRFTVSRHCHTRNGGAFCNC